MFGYFGAGVSVSKTYTNLPPHYKVIVSLTAVMYASWDSEEFWVRFDGINAF